MKKPFIQEHPNGIILKVFVQPRSSKNMIVGLHGDALKIKLKAPPVDNAANKMCIQYLAKCLKVPKSSLEIIAGHTSRSKLILLHAADPKLASKSELKHLERSILSLINR